MLSTENKFKYSNRATDIVTNILEPPISRLVALRILPKTVVNVVSCVVNGKRVSYKCGNVESSDSNFGDICLRVEVLGCGAKSISTVSDNPCKLKFLVVALELFTGNIKTIEL